MSAYSGSIPHSFEFFQFLHFKGKIAIIIMCTTTNSGFSRNLPLTLKAPNKNCSRRHFNFLLLSFEENKA